MIKNSSANAGDVRYMGLIPVSGRSPGGGQDNPSSILDWRTTMDKGAWWATVHRVTKSWTQLKQFSMHA